MRSVFFKILLTNYSFTNHVYWYICTYKKEFGSKLPARVYVS